MATVDDWSALYSDYRTKTPAAARATPAAGGPSDTLAPPASVERNSQGALSLNDVPILNI